MILINLINDDAFVSAATADAYFIIHLVCLFMKTHLLALLQDNYLDLFVVLSQAIVWMREEYNSILSTPTKADKWAVWADTDILASVYLQLC